mmetsp:Transcript_49382/g.112494  ORF Transcript_49382/g.112494 Transcript_49382/m.112494 type:complete len:238 (+) Transcript_49382:660-1373(+)
MLCRCRLHATQRLLLLEQLPLQISLRRRKCSVRLLLQFPRAAPLALQILTGLQTLEAEGLDAFPLLEQMLTVRLQHLPVFEAEGSDAPALLVKRGHGLQPLDAHGLRMLRAEPILPRNMLALVAFHLAAQSIQVLVPLRLPPLLLALAPTVLNRSDPLVKPTRHIPMAHPRHNPRPNLQPMPRLPLLHHPHQPPVEKARQLRVRHPPNNTPDHLQAPLPSALPLLPDQLSVRLFERE